MKRFTLSLFLSATSMIFSYAQQEGKWVAQGNDLLPKDYFTWDLSAVSEKIVWALMCKGVDEPSECKIIRSVDGGTTWKITDLNSIAPNYVVGLFALSDSVAWITTGNKTTVQRGIFKTTNRGETWVQQYSVLARPNLIWAPTIKFVNERKGFFIDVWGRLVGQTEDGGNTWTTNPLSTPSGNWYWGQLTQNNWWDVKGDTLWWGTSRSIAKSLNGGKSWDLFSLNLPQQNTIQSIQFNPKGLGLAVSDVVTVGTYTSINETVILRSQDFGETWNQLNNLPFPISILTYIPGTENSFIGVSGSWFGYGEQLGKYTSAITKDGGNSWKIIDQGIPRSGIDFVSPAVGWAGRVSDFDYGTSNPAIFKWEGNVSTGIDNTSLNNVNLRVTPNPFSQQSLLEFELEDSQTPVEITIADLLGRTIFTQIIKRPNAGINQIPLHLTGPSGLLSLSLKQGQGVKTLKILKQ